MQYVPVRSIPIHELKPGDRVKQNYSGNIIKLDIADVSRNEAVWAQMCGQEYDVYLVGDDPACGGRVNVTPERDINGLVIVYDTVSVALSHPFHGWLRELLRIDWFLQMAAARKALCPFCIDSGRDDEGGFCNCKQGRFVSWVVGDLGLTVPA